MNNDEESVTIKLTLPLNSKKLLMGKYFFLIHNLVSFKNYLEILL